MKKHEDEKVKAPYTVQQLALLAGVSVRTLHYYDETGLLSPSYTKPNGYRFYEQKELLLLQQILFFRELEFPLDQIKQIIHSPNFAIIDALKDQKKLIEVKQKRLNGLLETIKKTMSNIKDEEKIEDKELYESFNKEEQEAYQKEAKERWGNTDAWKQSQERYKKMSPEKLKEIQKAGEDLLTKMVELINEGATPSDNEVQKLTAVHYDGLRNFYEPSPEMYKGLGSLYVDDARFTAYYDKFQPGLAIFMRDAMHVFADGMLKK